MRAFSLRIFSAVIFLSLLMGCANIVPPTGGKKDTVPPKLLEISPKDSLLNTRVTEISMRFNEFLALENASKEIQISPVMPFPLTTVLNGKKLVVSIPDSLLSDSTTYRISFGTAIRDLNEGNVFKDFSYLFSTGAFFDSLKVNGIVYEAVTGKPASDVTVLLYPAEQPDSAIVRKKPMYVTKTKGNGSFLLPGLPSRAFRIYALKDDNENLVYDGENEKIGFIDSVIIPSDTIKGQIVLRVFKEIVPIDTTLETDTTALKAKPRLGRRRDDKSDSKELRYSVAVDTSNLEKRTFDLNKPVKITFNNPIDTYYTTRVSILLDSSDVEMPFTVSRDTVPDILFLNAAWKENTLYTIKIFKDFVADTAGQLNLPSKHVFRTLGEEDYGVIKVNIASAYFGNKYRLVVTTDKDTVYNQPILDTAVSLRRLLPNKYNLSIIVDENENGIWDTGNLFEKLQPELVIPHNNVIELKAGWENVIDFVVPVIEAPSAKGKPKMGTPPVRGDRQGAK